MVKDGYYYGAAFLVVAAVLGWLTVGWAWPILPVLLAAFFLWFFRNPPRTIPTAPGLIVSPGDGVVTETVTIETPEGKRQRISVFLSVFNVHVNRMPIAGEITRVEYKKGLYLNAMNPNSAEQNEQSIITVRGEGTEVTFKQIAGLLARRIVCNLTVGQQVARGELMGLIKFGSRVDVILSEDAEIVVKRGDKVAGGRSVLAKRKVA